MVTMPNIEDFNNADYDPFEAELFAFGDLLDVHGAIAKLRREKGDVIPGTFLELVGVRPDDSPPTFTLLGYDDVANALLDYENFTNAVFHTTLGRTFGNTLSLMEPPGHTQYRRLFQKAFLPQNIARWGTEIVDVVVDELIGKVRGRGEADLIEEFTKRYPFEIIYRQLALPEGDGPIFHRLASSQLMPQTTEGQEAAGKLGTYFKALLDERRRNPGPDLASALVTAEIEGEQLPEDVVISFLRQLIAAAGDTTFRATSVTLTGLLTNPDQLDAVKADRSLIPQTVEEGLRWETPTSWTERTAARDMVAVSYTHLTLPTNREV